MDVLLVITLVCFFALFAAAFAIARRIRIVAADPHDLRQSSHWLVPGAAEPKSRNSASRHPAEQAIHHLVQQKEPDWRFLIAEQRHHRWSRQGVSPAPRKSPASVHLNGKQRPDWVYFNRGLGDLEDPYEPRLSRAANGDIYLESNRREARERIRRIK